MGGQSSPRLTGMVRSYLQSPPAASFPLLPTPLNPCWSCGYGEGEGAACMHFPEEEKVLLSVLHNLVRT